MHDFHHPSSKLPIRSRDHYFAILVGRLYDEKSEPAVQVKCVKVCHCSAESLYYKKCINPASGFELFQNTILWLNFY